MRRARVSLKNVLREKIGTLAGIGDVRTLGLGQTTSTVVSRVPATPSSWEQWTNKPRSRDQFRAVEQPTSLRGIRCNSLEPLSPLH